MRGGVHKSRINRAHMTSGRADKRKKLLNRATHIMPVTLLGNLGRAAAARLRYLVKFKSGTPANDGGPLKNFSSRKPNIPAARLPGKISRLFR